MPPPVYLTAMGTRNLVAVKVDGEYKVAQYGQWDGYPDGQGKDLLNILAGLNLETLKERCRQAVWITPEQHKQFWVSCGAKPDEEWVSMDVSSKFKERYPQLSRDAGAKVVGMVATSEPGILLVNNIEFAADSLMCEWAYVVDFDLNTFEVFKGFNQEYPLSPGDRFYGFKYEEERPSGKVYHPVRLVAKWTLDALPAFPEFKAYFDAFFEEEEKRYEKQEAKGRFAEV